MGVCAKFEESSSKYSWDIVFTRMGQRGVAVTLTFDVRPPKSNQFIFKSKWTFVPNLKTFPSKLSGENGTLTYHSTTFMMMIYFNCAFVTKTYRKMVEAGHF